MKTDQQKVGAKVEPNTDTGFETARMGNAVRLSPDVLAKEGQVLSVGGQSIRMTDAHKDQVVKLVPAKLDIGPYWYANVAAA